MPKMSERGITPREAAARYLYHHFSNALTAIEKDKIEEIIDATMTDRQFERVFDHILKAGERIESRLKKQGAIE